jgi:hypothetical protein
MSMSGDPRNNSFVPGPLSTFALEHLDQVTSVGIHHDRNMLELLFAESAFSSVVAR